MNAEGLREQVLTAVVFTILFLALSSISPEWEIQLNTTPRVGPQLVPDGTGGQCILIPLGNSGLGGWSNGGVTLPGFPLSSGAGVIWRPAAARAANGTTLIAYADNAGFAHLAYLNGNEAPGWPVNTGSSIVTGVSIVDLNCDDAYEIAFGTSDGLVWLIRTDGGLVPGWPVDLSSQLLWQPTQVSLGGETGKGLVCALSSSVLTVLDFGGAPLPGWPITLPLPVGSNPVSGDLNSNGQADIIFACQNRRFNLFSVNGRQQDGWPYYLSDRPVWGSVAVGMINPAASSPQAALSTVDSLVYLVNGDGSLAESWRWPVKTESAAFQPIVIATQSGIAVLAATEGGMIHAWNAEGESMNGFPFQHPGGVACSPVAGDLDGDGLGELVVLGRGGSLAAYSLHSPQTAVGLWPLPLADPANSGGYGGSNSPVVTIGEIATRVSGDVTIPFSVTPASVSSLRLFYSLDAGYSWVETRSFTRNPGMLVWHTDLDIPHGNERQVAVRVIPVFQGGSGECGISRIFQVDNNIPPTILLDPPDIDEEGLFTFTYSVEDPEEDIIQIQAQYSTDGGSSWQTMHLRGTTLEISPWFYGEAFQWNSEGDLGQSFHENLSIRVRAADSKPGPWHTMEGLSVDTREVPATSIVVPEELTMPGETAGDS